MQRTAGVGHSVKVLFLRKLTIRMLRTLFVLFGMLLALTTGRVAGQSVPKPRPVPVIFDTDMGPDYDDVGAIGKAITDKDAQHWSDTITARYPHAVRSNADVPDAVALYRQLLAKQPDRSVTIISVGFMTNLATLISSKPDQYSRLSGKELVAQKVKQLVSMAGKFPGGKEYNVYMDTPASNVVFANWPTPVLLSGFEIGEQIHSGIPLIRNARIRNSPVKDVFAISIPKAKEDAGGRMSWDQTAVLVGVKGYLPYYTVKSGRLTMNPDGSNGWDAAGKGHQYLVVKAPVPQVEKIINELMQHQPVKR